MWQVYGQPVPTILVDVARLSLWLTLLVAIFVPLERLFAAHPKKILRKGIVADLGYYFLSSLLPAVVLSVPLGLLAWGVRQVVPADLLAATAALPLWAGMTVGLVVGEIGYYWGHRLCHTVPVLWRFHAIHHSAEEMDFLVNTRAHPVDLVFGKFCGLVPIYVLGLGGPTAEEGSWVPVVVGLFGAVWGFFIHANVRWRFALLEWAVSTPAFHHWHHTLDGPVNKNYSSTLPWLDRLFGTYHLPPDALPTAYGVREKVPDALVDQLVYPLFPPGPVAASSETPVSSTPEPVGGEVKPTGC